MLKKILIVEDQPEQRRLLQDFFEIKHIKTCEAGTAKEALVMAETELPDLIMMDINMPHENGLWATRRLKENPKTARIPVIAVTANILRVDEEKARRSGCNGYLTKPLELSTLVATLEAFLS